MADYRGIRAYWNWQPRILAFIEGDAEFALLDFSKHSFDGPPSNSISCVNFQYIQKVHPAFLCPSDSLSDKIADDDGFPGVGSNGTYGISQSDYACCIGDYRNDTGIGQLPAYGYKTVRMRGMMGIMGWSAGFNEVPDGLSNTIMVGECIGAVCLVQNYGVQSWATTAHPINYMNESLLAGFPDIPSTTGNKRFDESIGFRSMHPGGANFSLGDGSVTFFNDTIEGAVYRGLASREGGEIAQPPQ